MEQEKLCRIVHFLKKGEWYLSISEFQWVYSKYVRRETVECGKTISWQFHNLYALAICWLFRKII